MDIEKLFNEGISFEAFLKEGEDSYREKAIEILNDTNFNEEITNRIKSIDKKINILALAEIWCPDCVVNVPVLQKFNEINKNINFSIIKREGKEDYFSKYAIEDKVKIPTFIFFDEEFNEIGYFVERPSIVKNIYDKKDQVEIIITTKKYRNGQYTEETAKDILDILGYWVNIKMKGEIQYEIRRWPL